MSHAPSVSPCLDYPLSLLEAGLLADSIILHLIHAPLASASVTPHYRRHHLAVAPVPSPPRLLLAPLAAVSRPTPALTDQCLDHHLAWSIHPGAVKVTAWPQTPFILRQAQEHLRLDQLQFVHPHGRVWKWARKRRRRGRRGQTRNNLARLD